MNAFYEHYRLGSAQWACEAQIKNTGLFNPCGVFLGFDGQHPLFLDNPAPLITIGGAGSGKLRDLLAYNLCGIRAGGQWRAPARVLINDPRGELAAISLHNQVRFNKAAYCINPYRLHDLPSHRLNPWDVIKPESPTFHADSKLLVSDLIPLSNSANSEYFELRARQWSEALVQDYVVRKGSITLPEFYELINAIEDPREWQTIGDSMMNSSSSEVRRTAIEMDNKRHEAPKEYSAIFGEIIKSVAFLSDPLIRETLSGEDLSLEVLCQRDCNVYLMIPAEYVGQLAPFMRAVVGSAMLYKQRHPSAPRVLFLIDEAATLGKFEALLRAYSYGRGMGIRTWSIFQDVGQLKRIYGAEALSGFLGSSQVRQFFGVRDLETAKMISQMLGKQTLEYDPDLEQAAARRNKAHIIRELLAGADPFEAGLNYAHQSRAAISRNKIARDLMTPDEILNMPEDRQIVFISGLNIGPVFANKYPYYTRREMAGAYMNNPYHPAGDAVNVITRFGVREKRIVTERVPSKYQSLPQYPSGQWSYIKGYRPS